MIDIHSKAEYPSCELSNFAKHHFVIDGVSCNSMEGFLQSLKYKSPRTQLKICLKVGTEAKSAGDKKRLWRITKKVYWQGKCMSLFSDELQILIDRAYFACFEQCAEYRKALLDTGNEKFSHSIGKTDASKTILTEYNFLRRLETLKMRLIK